MLKINHRISDTSF